MGPFHYLLNLLIDVVEFGLFGYIILRMMVSFEVVNPRAKIVVMLLDGLGRVYEPILEPIRERLLRFTGVMDFSPIVVWIGLELLRAIINSIAIGI